LTVRGGVRELWEQVRGVLLRLFFKTRMLRVLVEGGEPDEEQVGGGHTRNGEGPVRH